MGRSGWVPCTFLAECGLGWVGSGAAPCRLSKGRRRWSVGVYCVLCIVYGKGATPEWELGGERRTEGSPSPSQCQCCRQFVRFSSAARARHHVWEVGMRAWWSHLQVQVVQVRVLRGDPPDHGPIEEGPDSLVVSGRGGKPWGLGSRLAGPGGPRGGEGETSWGATLQAARLPVGPSYGAVVLGWVGRGRRW